MAAAAAHSSTSEANVLPRRRKEEMEDTREVDITAIILSNAFPERIRVA